MGQAKPRSPAMGKRGLQLKNYDEEVMVLAIIVVVTVIVIIF